MEKFINEISTEELENLIKDYFNILDGVHDHGDIPSVRVSDIERRDNLLKKYNLNLMRLLSNNK